MKPNNSWEQDTFPSVLVCVQREALECPAKAGLGLETFDALPFALCESDAQRARETFSISPEITCAFVVSDNTMPCLNVAAALKGDCPEKRVVAVASEQDAWFLERACRAGVDEVIEREHFASELLKCYFNAQRMSGAGCGKREKPCIEVDLCRECDVPEPEYVPCFCYDAEASWDEAALLRQDVLLGDASPVCASPRVGGEALPILNGPVGAESYSDEMRPTAFLRGLDPTLLSWDELCEPAAFGSVVVDQPPVRSASELSFAASEPACAAQEPLPMTLVPSPAMRPVLPTVLDEPSATCANTSGTRQVLGQKTVSHQPLPTFFVPVVSAGGGVGKSTCAYLSALYAARFGYRTLLVDFDAQFGDMAQFVPSGDDAPLCADALLSGEKRVSDLRACSDGFALLAAASSMEGSEEVLGNLERLLEMVAPSFDVVIANTAGTWTEQHIALLGRASKVLFVLDQRPAGIKAAQRAFDLCLRCGVAAAPFLFVLNKCGHGASLSALDVSLVIKGMNCIELHAGGRCVSDCLASGHAADLVDESNQLCLDIERMLHDVLPGCSVLKAQDAPARWRFSFFGFGKKRSAAACL